MVRAAKPPKRRAPARGGSGSKPTNYIASWRKFRGIESQGALSKLSGITRATINRLESGKLPYRQWLLEKLAEALQCEPGDLIKTDPYGVPDVIALYLRIPVSKRGKAKQLLASLMD